MIPAPSLLGRWTMLGLAVTLIAPLVAGCGDGGSPGPEDLEQRLATGAEVRVVDFAFEPGDVTVAMGELVVFTNEGDTTHTITADDDTFDAGEQRPGDTFRYDTARDDPGAITYHCAIHPRMRGRVRIEAASQP